MVIESDRWLELPSTAKLQAHIAKRAAKEKWSDHRTEPGQEFRCLVVIKGGGQSGVLEVQSGGHVLATLSREDSESAMAQMRADDHLRATTVRTRAVVDEAGHWRVTINL